MKKNTEKNDLPLLLRDGWSSFFFSVLCILLGLLIGFLTLTIINPKAAPTALTSILRNYFYYKNPVKVRYYFGSALVKTVPLILCSLSVLFSRKTGLFNIGVAGQYAVGAGAALWCALLWQFPWYLCILAAMLAAALFALLTGIFKAYCSVNEVLSGIMLNWIGLYLINMLMTTVKDPATTFTLYLQDNAPGSLLPELGFFRLFGGNHFTGIGLLIAPLTAIVIWILLNKTKLGYELRATGFNPNAAFYCGMKEKKNILLSTAISGALAGLGAALFYLTDIDQWDTSAAVVPAMGFDGIAAAFLGGLHPIGSIFSSYFIKHISLGGVYLDKNIYNSQIADMICSIIIYFCGFIWFFRFYAVRLYKKHIIRKEQQKGGSR